MALIRESVSLIAVSKGLQLVRAHRNQLIRLPMSHGVNVDRYIKFSHEHVKANCMTFLDRAIQIEGSWKSEC